MRNILWDALRRDVDTQYVYLLTLRWVSGTRLLAPGILHTLSATYGEAAYFRTLRPDAQVRFYREAELKHCRVAMLAAVGFPLAEQSRRDETWVCGTRSIICGLSV